MTPPILFIGGSSMKTFLKISTSSIIFLIIFSLLFSEISSYMRRPDDESDEIHAFYDEPKNSIDILFSGSSPMLRGISPMIMWEQNGFTSYVRASASQAPSVTYSLLEESLKYQKPKLVVLLCDNIFLEYDYVEREGDLRRALDGMKISKEKFQAVQKITTADNRQTLLSYMFPLFRYHERWKELDITTIEPNQLMDHSFKKGNVYLRGGDAFEYEENFMEPTGIPAPEFNLEAKNYIEKTIDLCQEQNIPVLIIHLPKITWSYEESQALESFSKEMNSDYLDFDIDEIRSQLNLDPATDYYDQGHMNLSGSIKISKWFSQYLDTTYNLPDHRTDFSYNKWNEDYQLYFEKISK